MLKPKFWNIERQCLQRDLNIDEVLNKNVASRNLCRRIAKSWYTNLKPDMREVWGPEVTGPRPSAVICVHEELEPEVADPRLVVKTGGVSSRVIQRMSSCTLCVGLEPRKLSCCNRAEGFVLAFAYCFSSSALRYSSASRSYTTWYVILFLMPSLSWVQKVRYSAVRCSYHLVLSCLFVRIASVRFAVTVSPTLWLCVDWLEKGMSS